MKRARDALAELLEYVAKRLRTAPVPTPASYWDGLLPELQKAIALGLPVVSLGKLFTATFMFQRHPELVASTMRELCAQEWKSPITGRHYRLFHNFRRAYDLYCRYVPDAKGDARIEALFWLRAYFHGSRTIRIVLTIFGYLFDYNMRLDADGIRAVVGFDLRDTLLDGEWGWFPQPQHVDSRRAEDIYLYGVDGSTGALIPGARPVDRLEYMRSGDTSRNNWLTVPRGDRRDMMRGPTTPPAIAWIQSHTRLRLSPRVPAPIALGGSKYRIGDVEADTGERGIFLPVLPVKVVVMSHVITAGTLTVALRPNNTDRLMAFRAGPGATRSLRFGDSQVVLMEGQLTGTWELYTDARQGDANMLQVVATFHVTAIDFDVLLTAMFTVLFDAGGLARHTARNVLHSNNKPLAFHHRRIWNAWEQATLAAARLGVGPIEDRLDDTEFGAFSLAVDSYFAEEPEPHEGDDYLQSAFVRRINKHFLAPVDERLDRPVAFQAPGF